MPGTFTIKTLKSTHCCSQPFLPVFKGSVPTLLPPAPLVLRLPPPPTAGLDMPALASAICSSRGTECRRGLWSGTWANPLLCASVSTTRKGVIAVLAPDCYEDKPANTPKCTSNGVRHIAGTRHVGWQPRSSRYNSNATSCRKSYWISQSLPNLRRALTSLTNTRGDACASTRHILPCKNHSLA